MEQLIDTMSNEELAFLSYGKTNKIRSGTGIIGGFYNSGITGKSIFRVEIPSMAQQVLDNQK